MQRPNLLSFLFLLIPVTLHDGDDDDGDETERRVKFLLSLSSQA